ncbi:MAG: hypothetical protein GXO62_01445 [Epsilonproteobacteria bacterium]|nr:hypothetical protein [Campylobacterota bacterium]
MFKKSLYSAMAAGVLFLGCSAPYREAPQATNYKYSTQHKLQAMYHWKLIAKDMANYLFQRITSKVYVESEEKTDFEKTFVNLLKSELIQKGINVCNNSNCKNKIIIKINVVKFSPHRDWWNDKQFALTMIGAGVFVANHTTATGMAVGGISGGEALYAVSSKTTSTPQYEISITSYFIEGDTYKAAINRIYYIKDKDIKLYKIFKKKKKEEYYMDIKG